MVSARKTLGICLNGSLLLQSSSAFTAPTNSPSLKRAREVGPLHSFEVMESVGASFEVMESVGATVDTPVMSAINSFFQTQPYLAGFLTCSFKASAADMFAQTQELGEEKTLRVSEEECEISPNNVDISRNLGFLFYGGMYQGMVQNYLFNVIYPSWFGTDDSLTLIGKEVLVDNLVFAPLLCLPIAYSFKAAFTSDKPLGLNVLREGLEKYVSDVTTKGLLVEYWKIWFPANIITFGVIPSHYRVVFVAAISFFWVCMLSSISNSEEATSLQEDNAMCVPTLSQER